MAGDDDLIFGGFRHDAQGRRILRDVSEDTGLSGEVVRAGGRVRGQDGAEEVVLEIPRLDAVESDQAVLAATKAPKTTVYLDDFCVGDGHLADYTDDSDNIIAAINSVEIIGQTTGVAVVAGAKVYAISKKIEFPAWVSLIGQGKRTATNFRCVSADAGLRFTSRGGLTGNFTIKGHDIATEPFWTSGVNCTFLDVDVRSSAGHGIRLENAQNCVFIACQNDSAWGSGILLDSGHHNNRFYHTCLEKSGRYFVESRQLYTDVVAVNEIKTLTVTATGGTYTLTFYDSKGPTVTTAPIAYNADAATIKAALLAAGAFVTGDVTVAGAGPYTLTFAGTKWGGQFVPPITADPAGLTGGTAAVAVTTAGHDSNRGIGGGTAFFDGGIWERPGAFVDGGAEVSLGGILVSSGTIFFSELEIGGGANWTDWPLLKIGIENAASQANARFEATRLYGYGTGAAAVKSTSGQPYNVVFTGHNLLQSFDYVYDVTDTASIQVTGDIRYDSVTTRFRTSGTKTYSELVQTRVPENLRMIRPAGSQVAVWEDDTAGVHGGIVGGQVYLGRHSAPSGFITNLPSISGGTASPESVVTAQPGSIYMQVDSAGAVADVWTKAKGTGTTGWIAGFRRGLQIVATNANITISWSTSPEQTLHTGTLTADRTVTLNTSANASAGLVRRITRTGGGAFNLDIGPGLTTLATNQWCECVYDGTAWVLFQRGTLT